MNLYQMEVQEYLQMYNNIIQPINYNINFMLGQLTMNLIPVVITDILSYLKHLNKLQNKCEKIYGKKECIIPSILYNNNQNIQIKK